MEKAIAFAAEFEPAESLGRRRSPRAPVSLDARIGRGGIDRALCKITDISAHGARLQAYSELRQGTTIWLTLPKVGHCAARIVWAGDFEAGVEFLNPLTDEAFALLTAQ
ncbi:PilZ domain-containing protein [Sphingomonas canadensis]|uniref:PilZ domain-containing protein n=1 Tax=Sphingomonas canadensis TaxID=1219257 RepID=A0ABW3HAK9_9SPHN|nr:PilZ domain-containing protein [Sphingomonas canadensis]MCW3837996.1 PilZ domain-containing protein [Sphingomonas canadensis]